MTEWSLATLLAELHHDIEQKLATARKSFGHAVATGDASEGVWLELLQNYLPLRYKAEKAFVCDSEGNFSQQMDVVIFDRQYSPFIFTFQGNKIVPAESVYAVFEAKQAINKDQVEYATKKVESVRNLRRTSLLIPHAGGVYPAKPLHHIVGGLLTFESEWKPPMGDPLTDILKEKHPGQLDMGCIAAHGIFRRAQDGSYEMLPERRPATGFLFELIARLQEIATVPMIDIRAYGRWLEK